MTTKREILEEAVETVAGRGKSYGTVEENFMRIVRRWHVHILNRHGIDVPVDPLDVAIMMGDVKIARLENDPSHHDSWVDLAGYAACGGELASFDQWNERRAS